MSDNRSRVSSSKSVLSSSSKVANTTRPKSSSLSSSNALSLSKSNNNNNNNTMVLPNNNNNNNGGSSSNGAKRRGVSRTKSSDSGSLEAERLNRRERDKERERRHRSRSRSHSKDPGYPAESTYPSRRSSVSRSRSSISSIDSSNMASRERDRERERNRDGVRETKHRSPSRTIMSHDGNRRQRGHSAVRKDSNNNNNNNNNHPDLLSHATESSLADNNKYQQPYSQPQHKKSQPRARNSNNNFKTTSAVSVPGTDEPSLADELLAMQRVGQMSSTTTFRSDLSASAAHLHHATAVARSSKTLFDIDAPRKPLPRHRSCGSDPSQEDASLGKITAEQRAWAGIDEVLQDGNESIATRDVLPEEIVKAMSSQSTIGTITTTQRSFSSRGRAVHHRSLAINSDDEMENELDAADGTNGDQPARSTTNFNPNDSSMTRNTNSSSLPELLSASFSSIQTEQTRQTLASYISTSTKNYVVPLPSRPPPHPAVAANTSGAGAGGSTDAESAMASFFDSIAPSATRSATNIVQDVLFQSKVDVDQNETPALKNDGVDEDDNDSMEDRGRTMIQAYTSNAATLMKDNNSKGSLDLPELLSDSFSSLQSEWTTNTTSAHSLISCAKNYVVNKQPNRFATTLRKDSPPATADPMISFLQSLTTNLERKKEEMSPRRQKNSVCSDDDAPTVVSNPRDDQNAPTVVSNPRDDQDASTVVSNPSDDHDRFLANTADIVQASAVRFDNQEGLGNAGFFDDADNNEVLSMNSDGRGDEGMDIPSVVSNPIDENDNSISDNNYPNKHDDRSLVSNPQDKDDYDDEEDGDYNDHYADEGNEEVTSVSGSQFDFAPKPVEKNFGTSKIRELPPVVSKHSASIVSNESSRNGSGRKHSLNFVPGASMMPSSNKGVTSSAQNFSAYNDTMLHAASQEELRNAFSLFSETVVVKPPTLRQTRSSGSEEDRYVKVVSSSLGGSNHEANETRSSKANYPSFPKQQQQQQQQQQRSVAFKETVTTYTLPHAKANAALVAKGQISRRSSNGVVSNAFRGPRRRMSCSDADKITINPQQHLPLAKKSSADPFDACSAAHSESRSSTSRDTNKKKNKVMNKKKGNKRGNGKTAINRKGEDKEDTELSEDNLPSSPDAFLDYFNTDKDEEVISMSPIRTRKTFGLESLDFQFGAPTPKACNLKKKDKYVKDTSKINAFKSLKSTMAKLPFFGKGRRGSPASICENFLGVGGGRKEAQFFPKLDDDEEDWGNLLSSS